MGHRGWQLSDIVNQFYHNHEMNLPIVICISFDKPALWLAATLVVCQETESLSKKATTVPALRAYFIYHLARHQPTIPI